MNDYRIRITKHAYKRYRQRVGKARFGMLYQRCQTALMIGHYRHKDDVIKLYGAWWGCAIENRQVILTTCYGKLDYDLIRQRATANGV